MVLIRLDQLGHIERQQAQNDRTMIASPNHPQELQRLASLRSYHVLDTPPDPAFDDLTALAAEICGVPISLISLLDEDRQWFKSKHGIDVQQTGRDIAFCGHAICEEQTFVVEDATKDPRFSDNPLVAQAPNVRFYAGALVRDEQGLALGTLCIIDDKPRTLDTEQRRQLERIARQASRQLHMHKMLHEMQVAAHIDDLTGLFNRRGLIAQLNQIKQHDAPARALVFIDLNRFKPINDSLGHEAGDAVLRKVAHRLGRAVHELSTTDSVTNARVARIGGDEFVVAIHGHMTTDWVEQSVLPELTKAITQPISWHDRQLVVSAAFGFVEVDADDHLDIENALRDADIAMYEAKRTGSGYMRFDKQMYDKVKSALDLEDRLRKAIRDEQIHAAFEPIMDLNGGTVLGFEALARWTDPQLGPISPMQFIPIAEQTGLIDDVFKAVANDALKACRMLNDQGEKALWFSVNLSKAQLNDDRLFAQLEQLLKRHSLPAHRLQLEITESLVASCESIIPRLHHLRAMGHVLMLDDFGAGTSSLSCLKNFPVQWIKIDRDLTRAATTSRDYAAVVHAVSDLTRNIGLRLIAEGIEGADTIAMMQSMEVGSGQGWYWSKPISPADLLDWYTSHAKPTRMPKAKAG